ncbi:uncharacterized protein F4822DRAFT_434154 [Hypoxylon trugodes]|uniref:uncharacterized protein n=1 Tax=Hypoxylon trugodes TaxID=326681 RepID=UPI0021939773|nr:uncharacterized protein F4822DRAFT_434154 [Hypoxylon trugodes]KAI1384216.1 hypothetical protein F4822DRAFT_434154 [Hypoxylon trugodes]
MPSSTLLMDYIPRDGFIWQNKDRIPTLKGPLARTICREMKRRAGKRLDRGIATKQVATLFYRAHDLIHQCQEMGPEAFWREVGQKAKWAKDIEGVDLYEFSIKVIAARRRFHAFKDWVIDGGNVGKHSDKRFFNAANDAIDKFTGALKKTYGQHSETRNLYYPKWTDDQGEELREGLQKSDSLMNEEIDDLQEGRKDAPSAD